MEIELAKKELCNGCQTCRVSCPQSAIQMVKNAEGFLVPEINENLCIKCHKCEKVCPILNGTSTIELSNNCIIAKSKDEVIRMSSSSGGVFSHIAEYIVNTGGVVAGAAFAKDYYSVEHVLINSKNELYKLRGSKYVQSNVRDIYKEVKALLDIGRVVLFSGTGCQIAGLKNFLSKDYENLYLVDVVCHGVPSPKFWSKYLRWLEAKHHGKAIKVNFRSKKMGWEEFGLEATFGENVYFNELKDDPYLQIFQRNISLRESCYHCKFKSTAGLSDISIGDLWGANKIAADFNDDKGISLVLIHSNKGKQLIAAIQNNILFRDINLQDAINNNRNIAFAGGMPENRSQFFTDFQRLSFEKILKKYTAISTKEKIKRTLNTMGLLSIAKKILHRGGVEADKNLKCGLLVVFEDIDIEMER